MNNPQPFLSVLFALISFTLPAQSFRPIVINPAFEHVKWGVAPSDLTYAFAAYVTSFDGTDDNDNDGDPDLWAIPEWVAYEIKGVENNTQSSSRPSKWITIDSLFAEAVAPTDDSYHVGGTQDLKEVKSDYRFVRGHMCPKDVADRISEDAGYNTHTTLNAVPQLQWQNNGIWKDLEEKSIKWAEKHGRIWVVCGPVFFDKNPALWLGQEEEVRVAVPDALFKVVIKENPDGSPSVLAFLFPNIIPKEEKELSAFLTSLNHIEMATGLTFLTQYQGDTTLVKSANNNLTSAQKKALVASW